MDDWFSEVTPVKLTNGISHPIRRTAYIVHCPSLHPIPYDVLKSLIEDSAGKVGLTVRDPYPSAP